MNTMQTIKKCRWIKYLIKKFNFENCLVIIVLNIYISNQMIQIKILKWFKVYKT